MDKRNLSSSTRKHEASKTYRYQVPQYSPQNEAGSVGALQSPHKNQTLNSTRQSLVNRDDSAPNTPENRSLKHKSSDLTNLLNSKVARTPSTKAFRSEMYGLSLNTPPSSNLNISPGQLSPSPSEARRTRSHPHESLPGNDGRPAKVAGPRAAGGYLSLSISTAGRAGNSVESPIFIREGNEYDESDDLYGSFRGSDHDASVFTRDALIPQGTHNAGLLHSSINAEAISTYSSRGSLNHQDGPSVRVFAPYAYRPPTPLATEMIICEAIVRPLLKREMGIAKLRTSFGEWKQQTSHIGWIYIYQIPNEVDRLKIGITQDSVERRLRSWTEQCGHEARLAYPSTESERESVPNIYRLEALVHAELAASRLQVMDCSCKIIHNEWFEEKLTHARMVVVKWSNWMRRKPYEEFRTDNWHLSLQHLPNLLELSRPSLRQPVCHIPSQSSNYRPHNTS